MGSLNLKGGRDLHKRALLFELIKQKNIDVMYVQETHSDCFNESDWKKEWEGEVVFAHMSSTRGGVAILFAKKALPFSCEVKHVIPGRLLFIRVQFENFKAVFVNVYAPTSGSERVLFLKDVNVKLQNCSSDEVLFLGGDFNCTENYRVDRNHLEPHAPSSLALKELIKTHCLCDVWRDLNNDVRQYTWAHNRGNFISFARLDRFYCFRHHCNIVKGCFITPTGFSDHCLVTCNVFIANVKPKSAYWHLNTSLFSDVNFRDVFVFFLEKFLIKKAMF